MKHKHHIIPKHMGGTDDPSNIITLTRAEHANAHRLLYEQHGKQEDLWAWKFLSQSADWAWIRGDHNPMKRPDVKAKMVASKQLYHSTHKESEITRERKRQSKLGSKNPAYGKHGFFASAHRKDTCPHCGCYTILGNLTRWHGDKCKHKT